MVGSEASKVEAEMQSSWPQSSQEDAGFAVL